MPQLPFSGLTAIISLVLCSVLPSIFLPRGYPAAWLLAATLLVIAAAWWRPVPLIRGDSAETPERFVIYSFAAYLLSFVVTTFYHGDSMRELDKPIRYALGMLLILGLARVRIEPSIARALICLAAGCALGYALYDRFFNQAVRVGNFMNEIQFGVLAAQIASLNAILALNRHGKHLATVLVFGCAALAATIASLMTGSITAALTLLAMPIALLLAKWWHPSRLAVMVTGLAAAMVVAVLVKSPMLVAERAKQTIIDAGKYRDEKARSVEPTTSTGVRIESFVNAWEIFLSSPIAGVGNRNYLAIRKTQSERGELSAATAKLGVAHNEFLDAMAKRGLIGLTGLLALLFGPAWVFLRINRRGNPDARLWATCGLSTCVGFILASLPQNVLTHSSGANFLVCATVLFLSLAMRAGTDKPAQPASAGKS